MITHWVVGFHGTRYCSTFTEHLTASCNFLSDHIAKKKRKSHPTYLFWSISSHLKVLGIFKKKRERGM